MALAEMYFDESEDSTHKILCVAGYLFKKEKRELLEQQWGGVLRRENLPYFRMVDCAHGEGVFEGFDIERRKKIQIELFDILKKHLESGISVTFDLRYTHLCPSALAHGISVVTPYALCSYFCMMQGRKWANDNNFDGEISYFFEAGHKHQSVANHIMNEVFAVPGLQEHYRYGGHAFLSKDKAIALQCGDIFAWQWSKYIKGVREGRKVRRDLWSLLEKSHNTIHFNEKALLEFRAVIQKTNDEIARKKLSAILRKYGV